MNLFNFPNQRIAESKKDLDWHISHVENFLTYTGTTDYAKKKREIAELFLATAGVLSPEQEKIICSTITQKYGDNFGPQYYVYPLIENRIEQIVSEYRTRPLKKKLMVNNEQAVIKKLDDKVAILSEKLMRDVNQELESSLGFAPQTEQPEMQIPEDLEIFFQKDFRTISEEIGEDILYQLLVVKKEKEKIYDALRSVLTSGRVHAYLDEKDGHPSLFIPHVLDCFYDVDSSEVIQKNSQFFIWSRPLSLNEIFNQFDVTEEQKTIIENYSNIMIHDTSKYKNWFDNKEDNFRPVVVCMEWVSRITKKFLVIKDEDGKEEFKILPEGYKKRKDREEDIRSIEGDDVRHIIMVGPAVVLSYGSLENQMQTKGNPKKRFLNVVGMVDDSRNGANQNRSLAKKLKYLQDFASEILYEIRINMRYIDGGVLIYDLANIPKEWMALGANKALEKVNFHLKRDRIQFINSKDRKQNTYANSVNLSQKGRLTELISLLSVIEEMADRISGISKEAQGMAGQYAKATTTETNMTASSIRMEYYLGPFDSFVDTLLERMILKAKFVYDKNQVFTYYGGDNQAKFLKIFEPFLQEDLGIHIVDNKKEYERKQRIDQIAERTFGNSQDLEVMLSLINVFNSESSTEAEAVVRKGFKAMKETQMNNEKMAQQQQQMAEETKRAAIEKQDSQAEAKLENNIEVAEIYAHQQNNDTITKETNANLRKAAEIENKTAIENNKENK